MADSEHAARPEPDAGGKRLGTVFYASLALSVAFLIGGASFPHRLADGLDAVRHTVINTFGGVYTATVLAALLLLAVLAVSPLGREKLGAPGDRPEFGRVSWVAMLISAGLGMGYLFWGTAEPLIHLVDPPHGAADPMSHEAAMAGMRYSFMFWGLQAWATYAVVAIAVGFAAYRWGRPMLISAALHPLFGDRVRGMFGTIVDVMSVLAILFGIATSIGLGTRELNAGLAHSLGVPDTYGVKIAIVAVLMAVSTISALTGIGRGIRLLSVANVVLCGALLVFVLVSGPTGSIISTLGDAVAGYAEHIAEMSLGTEDGSESAWSARWTYFFWAWWISWSPFVGVFIARISRGRTIRSVCAGVVLVPSLVSIVWFSGFGGAALQRQQSGGVDVAGDAEHSKAVATFEVFGTLPVQGLTTAVVLVVLALLFITSADSASFMLGSSTSGGSLSPPRPLRLMWAFGAAFAAILLIAGGRSSLHGAAVVAAVPFTVILILLAVGLCVSLVRSRRAVRAGGCASGLTRYRK